MAGSLTQGVPDSGMAYNYDLGNLPRGRAGRNALAAIKEARESRTAAAREARQAQMDSLRQAHESFRDSLAEQTARLQAANSAFNFNKEMVKMQKEEQALNDAANFHRFYSMLKDDDPNRKAQLAELHAMFPGAMKVPEINQMVNEDNKRLTVKPGLTKDEEKFLKDNGPGTNNWKAWQKSAADSNAADHITAAINYGRTWDLLKKQIGQPTGTPQGISVEDYAKNIQSTLAPKTAVPAAGTPPPSTPAPENVAGWSNADLSTQTAPVSTPASTGAPSAAPSNQHVRDFINSMGFKKTSDSGAAASAASDRNELNDMLGQTPETGFLQNKPAPTPTPTPAPQGNKEQYYTA